VNVFSIAAMLLTLAGPPIIMWRRRRWPKSAILVWVVAVAVFLVWGGKSAVYADTLPGGYNPEPYGVRAWFLPWVALGVLATVYAWFSTGRRRVAR
jgi:hypothetical protein